MQKICVLLAGIFFFLPTAGWGARERCPKWLAELRTDKLLISKTQYCDGRKCLKLAWLQSLNPHFGEKPNNFQIELNKQGQEVERVALSLFPDGVQVNVKRDNVHHSVKETVEMIKKGHHVLFDGTFVSEGLFIETDVLERNADGSWNLFEIESGTNTRLSYLHELAIQKYVLEQLGFKIQKVGVILLKGDSRGSDKPEGLYFIEPVDEAIAELVKDIPQWVERIRATLLSGVEPQVCVGSHCKSPMDCRFKSYCWGKLPFNSVHYISRLSDRKRQNLIESGYVVLEDIPEDYPLTDLQRIQVLAQKTGQGHMEREKILNHLDKLEYPIYFLDFEAGGHAVPRYPNSKPYHKLPFQFSLHVQEKPNADYQHYEFLHNEDTDPREAAADLLLKLIGPKGSIMVYHSSFEGGILEDLVPFRPAIEPLIKRLWDLEVPFAKKWFYIPQFQGRSSLKVVLPALVPELSYKDLRVQSGDMAMVHYWRMLEQKDTKLREQFRKDLLQYCHMDTWAMVKVLEKLRELLSERSFSHPRIELPLVGETGH